MSVCTVVMPLLIPREDPVGHYWNRRSLSDAVDEVQCSAITERGCNVLISLWAEYGDQQTPNRREHVVAVRYSRRGLSESKCSCLKR
jgi:hypothetical protein